jgi:hypothetical protein
VKSTNVTIVDPFTIKKVSGTAWAEGAYSQEKYGACHLTFIPNATNLAFIVGLDDAPGFGYTSMEHCFYIQSDGRYSVRAPGGTVKLASSAATAYTTGTTFEIIYDGAHVFFCVNGVIVHIEFVLTPAVYAAALSFSSNNSQANYLAFNSGGVAPRVPEYHGVTARANDRLKGDWYLNTSTKVINVWSGTAWGTSGVTSAMTMQAMNDLLDLVDATGATEFITRIVAREVFAELVAALKIYIRAGGAIFSGGYDANGNHIEGPGSYISSQGDFKGFEAHFESSVANDITVNAGRVLTNYIGEWSYSPALGAVTTLRTLSPESLPVELVVRGNGEAFAFWSTGTSIEYAKRGVSGSWGSPITLSTGVSSVPNLAVTVDSNDSILILASKSSYLNWWRISSSNSLTTGVTSLSGGSQGCLCKSFIPGECLFIYPGTNTEIFSINSSNTINLVATLTGLNLLRPSMEAYKVSSDGYLIAYIRANNVYCRTLTAGHSLGSEISIATTTDQHFSPSLTLLPDGIMSIIYARGTSAAGLLRSRTRAVDGSLTSELTIESTTNTSFCSSEISHDGEVLVVYRAYTNGYIYFRKDNSLNSSIPTGYRYSDLGAGIIETGQNTNGSYIKFSDGTMQQWGTADSSDTGYMTQNMPMPFINMDYSVSFTPYADSAFNTSRLYVSEWLRSNSTVSSLRIRRRYQDGDSTANSSINTQWIAIGRWK